MNATDTVYIGLLQAILAAPDDDTPRLILADWFEEHGDGERAEFIRVQCDIAEAERSPIADLQTCDDEKCTCWFMDLRRRERALLAKDGPPIHGVRSRFRQGKPDEHQAYRWMGVAGYAMTWVTFRRGFIDAVECRLEDWLLYGKELLSEHPVTQIRLTDRNPYYVSNMFTWGDYSVDNGRTDNSIIPTRILQLLPVRKGWSKESHFNETGSGTWVGYRTEQEAWEAVSEGLIAWVKLPIES